MERTDEPCTCGDPNCVPPGYWDVITKELTARVSSQSASTAAEAAGGASGPIATSSSSANNREALVSSLVELGIPGGGMRPVRITCPECRSTFTNNGALKRHVVTTHHKVYNTSSRILVPFADAESLAQAIANCRRGQQSSEDYQQILEHAAIEQLRETGVTGAAKATSARSTAIRTISTAATVGVTHRPLTVASTTVIYTATACKPSVGEIRVFSPNKLSNPLPAPACFIKNRRSEKGQIDTGEVCYEGAIPSCTGSETPTLKERRPGREEKPNIWETRGRGWMLTAMYLGLTREQMDRVRQSVTWEELPEWVYKADVANCKPAPDRIK